MSVTRTTSPKHANEAVAGHGGSAAVSGLVLLVIVR